MAIPKPNKDLNDVKDFHPIALPYLPYKLFERVILNRLQPILGPYIPQEQAGYRPGRDCCEQVALTSFIQSGFNKNLKTGAVFIDLSAAFDTVWTKGLLLKLGKIVKNQTIITLFTQLLSNRKLQVKLGDQKSNYRILNNGLRQGSILSPILFNTYISDLPELTCRKFQYADDLAIATQNKSFIALEKTLNRDMKTIESYLCK